MAKEGRAVKDLEADLEREKQDRADAEDRANRANDRAREADEAYRKLQLALVAAKDEATGAWDETKRLQTQVTSLEQDVKALREAAEVMAAAAAVAAGANARRSAAPSALKKSVPPYGVTISTSQAADAVTAQLEEALERIQGLRELLAMASVELSQLHADEVLLSKKRTRVLSDACALLQRAVGATGQAPPPIPSAALEARLSMSPVVDISEVADLIESLRPPRAPKVE